MTYRKKDEEISFKFRVVVLKGMHDDLSHLGVEWTLDIQKSRPTPYNPQGEPEHFNRTMLSILAMLNQEKKRNVVNTKYILYMTITALSVMPQDTPCFFLMFGREAKTYVLGHAQIEKPTKPTPPMLPK